MKRGWIVSAIVAPALIAGSAAAQTPPLPAPGGAFEQLSPGNQKIARAIFESRPSASTPLASARPLSLDQIAQMKQGGRGWGAIFHDMKAKGLVQDKNLGQAVSRFNHEHKSASGRGTQITTASGKTVTVGAARRASDLSSPGRPASGGDGAREVAGQGHANGGPVAGSTRGGGGSASHGGGRGK